MTSPVIDQLHAAAQARVHHFVDLTKDWTQQSIDNERDPLTVVPVALNIHLTAVLENKEKAVALLAIALMELAGTGTTTC